MPPFDAGTIYSEIRIRTDKLTGDLKLVEASFDKTGKEIDTSISQVEKKSKASFQNISLEGIAAMAGMTIAIKQTISTFARFEQSMANVSSVVKATPEDFKILEQAAMDAGETTRFSASQAADALYALGSAGLDAKESTEALNAVLQLAGATQSDLAFTSETVASILSQYNLEAAESARISNVFAAGIAASQATMQKLAVSFGYVGPVASAFNKSLEETTAVLSILYNNGFEASTAGTALRSSLASLSNASGPAIKKMKELGISFEDVNPQTKSFAEIIGFLKSQMLSGAEIMNIFGEQAGPAMIKLIEGGSEAIKEMTSAVTGTNAAADAYATQNDTLLGSFDELTSAVESAQIKLVKDFTPAIRSLLEFITNLVIMVGNAPAPLKIFFGVLAASIPVIIALNAAMGAFAALLTVTAGPVIAAVVVTVAALAAGISALQVNTGKNVKEWISQDEWIKKNTKSIQDFKKAMILESASKSTKQLKKDIEDANKQIKELEKNLSVMKSGKPINQSYELNFTGKNETPKIYTTQEIKEVQEQINALYAGIQKTQEEIAIREGKQAEKRKILTEEQLKANEKINEYTQKYKEKLEDLNSTEIEGIELQKQREIDAIKASEAELDVKNKAIAATERYYEALKKQKELEAETKSAAMVEEYRNKLIALHATQEQLIEQERKKALEQAKSEKATDEATKAINDYYDALKNKAAFDEFINNLSSISNSLASLFSSIGDAMTSELDRQMQAQLEANGLAEETTAQRLQRELDEAISSGDKEEEALKRKELKKAKIIEEYERKKADIQYKAALASWAMQLSAAIASGAQAVLNGLLTQPFIPAGIAAGAIAGIMAGSNILTVMNQRPQPPAFQSGGIIPGSSYQGDRVSVLANSGEMILNPEQQAMLFNWINKGTLSGKGITQQNEFNIYNQIDLDEASKDIARRTQAAIRI